MSMQEIIQERHNAVVNTKESPVYTVKPTGTGIEKVLVGHQVLLDTTYGEDGQQMVNVGFRPDGKKGLVNVRPVRHAPLIDVYEDVVVPALAVGFTLERSWTKNNGATQKLEFVHRDITLDDRWDFDHNLWPRHNNKMHPALLATVDFSNPHRAIADFKMAIWRMICSNGMEVPSLELADAKWLSRNIESWNMGQILADATDTAERLNARPTLMLGDSRPTEVVQKAVKYMDSNKDRFPGLANETMGLHPKVWRRIVGLVEDYPDETISDIGQELILTNGINHYAQNTGDSFYKIEGAKRSRTHSYARLNQGLDSIRTDMTSVLEIMEFALN